MGIVKEVKHLGDNITTIKCTHNGELHTIIMDTEDIDKIGDLYRIRLQKANDKNLYPYVKKPTKGIESVGGLIMERPPHLILHYKNGNSLDLRKKNLRAVTRQEHGKIMADIRDRFKRSVITEGKLSYFTCNHKGKELTVLMDTEDIPLLEGYGIPYISTCHSTDSLYCSMSRKEDASIKVRLHRVVLGIEYGNLDKIEFLNGNTLDCRKANLHNITKEQNEIRKLPKVPKSGFVGVTWNRRDCLWRASISLSGHKVEVGSSTNLSVALQHRRNGLEKYGHLTIEQYRELRRQQREVTNE